MIRIRILRDTGSLISRDRVKQIQEIFVQSFPKLAGYAEKIPLLIRDPIRHRYCTILVVAEGALGRVDGFALVMHFPEINFCFLDFIATRSGLRGRGVGSALYEAVVSEYCRNLSVKGLYFEVQPDLPELTTNPVELKQAQMTVRFYELHGVREIENHAYSVPVGDPPTTAILLFDGLGVTHTLARKEAQEAVKMILTTRFARVADSEYVDQVIESFSDDPVNFRPLRYIKAGKEHRIIRNFNSPLAYTSVFSPKHEIHHVKERGYFERPIRVEVIRDIIRDVGGFVSTPPREYGEKWILAVHDKIFVHYLRTVCASLRQGRPVYPDTFPIRRPDNRPKELPVQAGYYCIDTGTPLNANAYKAARAAVNTALTGADEILSGKRLAYSICRPPGHHAGKRFFGGFCYFNNAAIAANYLSQEGKVAVLDIDFHHGNGTQDIFYHRKDVLTVSIHGHPDYSYPYFSGYESERGEGEGVDFNRNFPLAPRTENDKYLRVFGKALKLILNFNPDILVVSLGFDILKGDPTGTFLLSPKIFESIGNRLISTKKPLLVIQEGGYNIRGIRSGSRAFLKGCNENRR